MDSSSQFIVPTIIDVPELIVTNEDTDYDETVFSGNIWFNNKLQPLITASSYIIGLGNVWRFPYLCYKHAGGAYLIAYTLMLIIVGLPLFLMELAFGQYANEGPITIWRISPAFEGIGYAMCLISATIAIYYNIINTWILHYLFASLTFGDLPWSTCDNEWNTARCFLKTDLLLANNLTKTAISTAKPANAINCTQASTTLPTSSGSSTANNFTNTSSIDGDMVSRDDLLIVPGNCSSSNSYEFDQVLNTSIEVLLPANEYFHNNVVELSASPDNFGGLNWSALFSLVIVWLIVFGVILKNLRPLSNRLTAICLTMPYLTLVALFARSITLQGSGKGVEYYFTPQWGRLKNIDIWLDATTQIFFSLSPCWGGILTLASMNKFHNNFHSNAILIVGINYLTSLFVGLIAFATLGYMSAYSGIALVEVVDSGTGFVFMVFTEVLAKLPLANINSFVFFASLLYLGLTSQLTVIETVITTIVDTWPNKLRYRRPLVLVILCAFMFLLSCALCFRNSFYLVAILDTFAGTFAAIIIGILELVAIAWVYGMENFMQDIDDMISVHRNLFPSRSYWYFLWRYLAPSVLFAILIFSYTDFAPLSYRDQVFPNWTMLFGLVLTLVCVSVIPAIALIRFMLAPRGGSILDRINYLCKPSDEWAPSSYVSGPKLINRHQMLDSADMMDQQAGTTIYTSRRSAHSYADQDADSNDSNEDDLKLVNGKANYIIPEEEEDTDTGLITNETDV